MLPFPGQDHRVQDPQAEVSHYDYRKQRDRVMNVSRRKPPVRPAIDLEKRTGPNHGATWPTGTKSSGD